MLSLFKQLKSYLCIFAWDTQRFSTPEVIVSECVLEALGMLKSSLEEIKSKHSPVTESIVTSITSHSSGSSSVNDTLLYCQKSWVMLRNPNSLVKNNHKEFGAYLERLGVCDAKDLIYFNDLEEDEKLKIQSFLKKIPFKKLLYVNSSSRDSSFNFDNAWEVLCDPHSVADKDPEALQSFLVKLGAYEARDLAYLDEEDKAHIQTLLRRMAVIKFLKNMNPN